MAIFFRIPSSYPGPDPIVNTATVTSLTADPVATNNSSSVETPFFLPAGNLHFHTLTPCRSSTRATLRRAAPSLSKRGASGRSRPHCSNCVVPRTARAIAVNVTVTEPTATGNLRLYPAGTASTGRFDTQLRRGPDRGNNAVVSLQPRARFRHSRRSALGHRPRHRRRLRLLRIGGASRRWGSRRFGGEMDAPAEAHRQRTGAGRTVRLLRVALRRDACRRRPEALLPERRYVFARVGGVWQPQHRFEGGFEDAFGASVALVGNTLVVGAPSLGPGSDVRGRRRLRPQRRVRARVRPHRHDMDLRQRIVAPDGSKGDSFGDGVRPRGLQGCRAARRS